MYGLIVLCGLQKSGKTTWAKKECRVKDWIHLSSDDLRAVICGDAGDQSKGFLVFSFMYTAVEYFLRQGKTVVVDATSVTKKDRKKYIDIAKRYNQEVHCVYFDVSAEEVKKRSRPEREVGDDVIDKFAGKLEVPTVAEGFKTILIQ
jgi:predicted kinase